MLAAVRLLANQARLVAEPGGAAAVAAWLYHREELPAAAAVAVVSGGNIDPALLAATLAPD
jgi:threonine dehydratase